MRVWIAVIGEPLPSDGANERLLRGGLLARHLVDAGHEVVWWSSTFDHVRKRHRFSTDTVIEVKPRLRLVLLHGVGYSRNVSFSRILNHWQIGRKFALLARREPLPAVILAALPSLELPREAVRYGVQHRVPVAVDIRDLWPDVFADAVPRFVRRVASALLLPFQRMARRALSGTASIIGLTENFRDWGLRHAGRPRGPWDRVFPLAYPTAMPERRAVQAARKFWRERGIRDDDSFKLCYIGNMTDNYELETVIEGARQLEQTGNSYHFVLCGRGDKLLDFKALARGVSSVQMPGWVDEAEIWTLLRMCHVGLAPYRSIGNFVNNITNKPIEYLSAGLPVLSSLKGVLQGLLADNDCGITYDNGDVDAFVSAITRLCRDPVRREDMSRNARRLFEARFTAEKVYGELASHLEELAATYYPRGSNITACMPPALGHSGQRRQRPGKAILAGRRRRTGTCSPILVRQSGYP